jgi:putative flavoprotein involved in K+ transport
VSRTAGAPRDGDGVAEPRVVIVGAGPAGLATARELRRRGIEARILERGERLAWSWENLYDSLTLHTGKHLSKLPGLPFPRSAPLFPHRTDFIDYLNRYARHHGLAVETDTLVTAAVPPADGGPWRLETSRGTVAADALVMATGIMAGPNVVELPGRDAFAGRVLHSIEYRRPGPFVGRRVLVVGVGNSGGEIGSELARAGAEVTVAVRSGANVVPLTLGGVPIQYLAFAMRGLPKPARAAIARVVGRVTELRRGPPVLPRPPYGPLDAIPLIGFHLVDAIRDGAITVRGTPVAFTPAGVRFDDGVEDAFDDVILATGFRPALAPLDRRVRTDARGFARRTDRVTSADLPRLVFVGHNYDSTGGLRNIHRDAPFAAERVAGWLRGSD